MNIRSLTAPVRRRVALLSGAITHRAVAVGSGAHDRLIKNRPFCLAVFSLLPTVGSCERPLGHYGDHRGRFRKAGPGFHWKDGDPPVGFGYVLRGPEVVFRDDWGYTITNGRRRDAIVSVKFGWDRMQPPVRVVVDGVTYAGGMEHEIPSLLIAAWERWRTANPLVARGPRRSVDEAIVTLNGQRYVRDTGKKVS